MGGDLSPVMGASEVLHDRLLYYKKVPNAENTLKCFRAMFYRFEGLLKLPNHSLSVLMMNHLIVNGALKVYQRPGG